MEISCRQGGIELIIWCKFSNLLLPLAAPSTSN